MENATPTPKYPVKSELVVKTSFSEKLLTADCIIIHAHENGNYHYTINDYRGDLETASFEVVEENCSLIN